MLGRQLLFVVIIELYILHRVVFCLSLMTVLFTRRLGVSVPKSVVHCSVSLA